MAQIWREYTITNHVEPHVVADSTGTQPVGTCLADVLNTLESQGWFVLQLFIHALGPEFSLVLVNCYQREEAPVTPGPDPTDTGLAWQEDRRFIPAGGNLTADYTNGKGGKAISDRVPLIAWEITDAGPVPWIFDHDNQTKPAASKPGFGGITLFR